MPRKIDVITELYNKTLKELTSSPQSWRILLHLDSDRAGSMGAQGLIAALREKYEVKYLPPSEGKDWNDYLCLKEKDKQLQKNCSNSYCLSFGV